MNDTMALSAEAVLQQRDAFIERLLQDAAGAFSIFALYLGDRLGFYRGLTETGSSTAGELAARTNTHERYVREWLEQQAVTGTVEVEDESQPAEARRFRLPAGHVEPLIHCDSLNYLAPLAQLIAGAVHPLPKLVAAYRDGGGVPYSAYGVDLREGQSAINYSMYMSQLAQEWLPAMPDVHARLLTDPPARIADIGCGYGWSSIGMAKGYPKARVDGFDLDAPSIEQAQANALRNGVFERVRFRTLDAGDPELAGRYDLVTAFECVHDMSDPVGVLSTMRRLAGKHGAVLVADERVSETFTTKGNEVEWMMYGFSILHCLPVGMADAPSVGTGTVMRAETLQRYAASAGFSGIEVLPIDNFFFRLYRLNH